MKLAKSIAVAGIVLGSLVTSAESFAGDCRGVKFRFVNSVQVADTAVQIKVKKIVASGNDGNWTENISNKRISGGSSYTTNKRKLNKLDSGSRGTFTVHYDRRQIGPGWAPATQTFSNLLCSDNTTFSFQLSNS